MTAPLTAPQLSTESISVAEVARRACTASRALAKLSTEERNTILIATAAAIERGASKILEANVLDCEAARPLVDGGSMTSAMFARLCLTEKGVGHIAKQVREVSALPD